MMAGREPVGIASTWPGLAASAAVALAYGVVLQVLPTVVASSPSPSPSPSRMIAELMAVYSAAMVVTAPICVRACRHLPAHLLVRLSLARPRR